MEYTRRMQRHQLLALASLVLLALATSHLLRSSSPLGRNVSSSPAAALLLEDRSSPQLVLGDASLTVVIFTDYRCPACRKADPAFREAISRDGNVRVVYRDWPIFGERSERAAEVALAAHQQGIYPPLHHQLMRSARFDDAALRATVEQVGGDWEQLEVDLRSRRSTIANQLANNRRDALVLGLQGTPAYLIGPVLIQGALTEREFLRAFEQARSEG